MMTYEDKKILNQLKESAINIKTLEEFKSFCMELEDNSYQYYDADMHKVIIPNIIENLAKEIDIKNMLNEWEEIICLLYYHFIEDFISHSLSKLYIYYPEYPIECFFELVLYNEPSNPDDIPFWYRTITKIYTEFYSIKMDNELFDKYLLFAYDDSRYFIALLYKNSFNIPKNSIYLDIEELLKKRFAYYGSMSNERLSEHGLLTKDIKKINIDRFTVHILKTTFLKSAIFETNDFKESKKKNSILESFYNFHDFLIYNWGVVKYFKYIYKYGNYDEYSKLYNDFFTILEEEARTINNTVAMENLFQINKVFNQKIIEIYPDEINEKILIEGAKKQITVNAYERNPKARTKCIERYGYDCFICEFNFKNSYGDIGKEFIHVHHLKPLSEIQEEYEVNPMEDLRPVCPNCHAMLHRKVPAYSIDEIKNILKGQ